MANPLGQIDQTRLDCITTLYSNEQSVKSSFGILRPVAGVPTGYQIELLRHCVPLALVKDNAGNLPFVLDTMVNQKLGASLYPAMFSDFLKASKNWYNAGGTVSGNERYNSGSFGNYLFKNFTDTVTNPLFSRYNNTSRIIWEFWNSINAGLTAYEMQREIEKLADILWNEIDKRAFLPMGVYTFVNGTSFDTAWDAILVTEPTTYGILVLEVAPNF